MSDSINQDTVVVAARKQISSDLKDEVAILSLDKGVYYGLNHVGKSVWKLLQNPISVCEIYSVLMDEYDVDEEVLKKDVLELLSRLKAEGLVEIVVAKKNSL